MHKNLLLCTAACALFFSSFTFTSISTASGLSPETRHALEGMIKLPEQYRYAIDVMSTPTQAEKNLEKIASGAMRGNNSQVLQKNLDEVDSRINSYFSGLGRYGSGAHINESQKARDYIRTQTMAKQHQLDTQHMLQANALLDRLRQDRLIKRENLLRGYEKALSNAAQAAAILDANNQQRIDATRQQWVKQDNHEWSKLQNKAEILHKAAKMDSALQGQNKELSDILRKAVLDTLNTEERTNVEGKGASDKFPSADVVSQHKDNSPLRTDREITQLGINKNTQSEIDPQTNTASSASKMALNTSASSSLDGAANVKTLTPQIENSFVMPIAMFAVGVADANNQNILLDNMQITMFEPKEYQERSIFLSTYGNKNTFFSRIDSKQEETPTEQEGAPAEQQSTPAEQQVEQNDVQLEQESVKAEQGSIHADIRYAALQAGAILIAREGQNINTHFGFFGTYGKLSFAPKNAESSHKKMFDKWSLTAYGNIQHDSGSYASGFLSYGILKENMRKDFIEDTPQIKNSKILGAAATVGQKLSTGFEGVILEPQAQIVYQRLILESPSDNISSSADSSSSNDDSFKINISKPDQWLLRIGGRLTQNKGHVLSFYGKLNMIKTFSKNFKLAAMGSLVEGGFGIQAHLSPNIELHSDLSYQHKFKKVGISGINISAGMRYHF